MVHLFDVDYTLIRRSTTWYFLREALGAGLVRFSQVRGLPFEWLRYKLGSPNQNFIDEAVRPLAGMDQARLEALAAACFTRRVLPNLYAEGERLIRELQSRGERVLFATSTFHTFLRPLEDYFGISGSLASDLEFSHGVTTGRLRGPSFFGPRKKTAVEAWAAAEGLSREDLRFYSDSYTDLPLLEFCAQPVAVNPDRILKRIARARGWEILDWR